MTDLVELYRLAEGARIGVDRFPLGSVEALSLQDGSGRCHIALDPAQLRGTADEKRKLAHELGHCATGSFYTRACRFELPGRCENRAEKWAIKKLVPKDELCEAYLEGVTAAWELAERFGVPESFMRRVMAYYGPVADSGSGMDV